MTGRIPDYDELKLRIERGTGDGYQVVAFAADGSTAQGTFSSPFSATELDNFVLRVGLPRRKVRTYRSSQMEEARRFGTELSQALLHGDVREVYLGARRAADARGPRAPGHALPDRRAGADGDPLGVPLRAALVPVAVDLHPAGPVA